MDIYQYSEYLQETGQWIKDVKINLENRTLNSDNISQRLDEMLTKLENVNEVSEVIELSTDIEQLYSTIEEQEKNNTIRKKHEKVPIGGHKLPPLPYDYNALQPYIDEEIMRLHHSKHHQSYVDGLNKAEKELENSRKTGKFDLIKHWEREAAFHGAGHYLHTIFWDSMSPKGGGTPTGEIGNQINKDFGDFKKFKQHFSEAAKKVEGVGWAILVWAPRARRLEILQAEKHQNLSQWDIIPLLPLDVWEHAYYLQYKNNRNLYVDNWWNIVNWQYVNERFAQASKIRW